MINISFKGHTICFTLTLPIRRLGPIRLRPIRLGPMVGRRMDVSKAGYEGWCPRRVGSRKWGQIVGPEGSGPEGRRKGGNQNVALFPVSRPKFRSSFSSLGVFSCNVLAVFEASGPQNGVLLSISVWWRRRAARVNRCRSSSGLFSGRSHCSF